ncbi:MAG: hypothetical protein JNL87_18995 [Burkholderiaceae bacterium]|nr:hypothetical protein [Burkholderiaceae bacterium]
MNHAAKTAARPPRHSPSSGRAAAGAATLVDQRDDALARLALAELARGQPAGPAAMERFQGETAPDQAEKPLPEDAEAAEGEEPDELDSLAETPKPSLAPEPELPARPGAGAPAGPSQRHAALFTADGSVRAAAPSAAAPTGRGRPAREAGVTGTPRVDMNAAGSTCTPDDILPADVDWEAEEDGKKWRAKATALRTAGQINVNPTPSLPNTLTTPNTANPVVGGNIDNTKGGKNHWKFAIKEMKEYHTPKGGRSNHWHSTVASTAHEQAHWDTDWLKNVLGPAWPAARKSIARVTIAKADAADAVAAKAKLEDEVKAKIKKFNTKTTKAWNAVPDEPGAWFANGYKAGQKVLDGLIGQVESFAKGQKW